MNIPKCIKENICLQEKTWFHLGGKAQYFAEINDYQEITNIIKWNESHLKLPIKPLGLGANVLFPDQGFNGIILQLPINQITHHYDSDTTGTVTASAGTSMKNLITYSLKNYLFGLEEFSGIPSSVGGALFINLHYYEFLIDRFVLEATICDLETGNIFIAPREWFNFAYDNSTLKEHKKYLLLDATFILKKNNELFQAYAEGRKTEIIRHRNNRYPHQYTCGCFFKNFTKNEVPMIEEKKITSAAFYIDQCNLRGITKIGNSFISSQHANMIIHNGQGKSSEIIAIARIMQEAVFKKFGLLLEPECELIGFLSYPLHTKETISL